VPVAVSADFLWQRGGRRRGDRARRCVHEQLECERAAQDGVLPRSAIFESIAPLAPGTARSRETGLDLGAGGQDERLLVGGAEDEQAAAACPRREVASDRGVARRRLAGSERADGDRVAAGRRDWYAGSALDSCR